MNRAKCSQAGCIQTDLKAYKQYLGHRVTILCGSCAASLQAIGMSLTPIERRETDLPVLTERRRIGRPRWLDNLTAREDTWRLSA
jgi:hypothetical protein